jgi:hypothetical protein
LLWLYETEVRRFAHVQKLLGLVSYTAAGWVRNRSVSYIINSYKLAQGRAAQEREKNMKKFAVLAAISVSLSAGAGQFAADPVGMEYLHRVIRDDIDVFQSGGRSMFTWAALTDGPFTPSAQKEADRAIDAWFAGERPPPGFTSAVDHGDILLFQMYWVGTKLPKNCTKDSTASGCEEQMQAAMRKAQFGDADFMTAYNDARGPLHLSTFFPEVERSADVGHPQRSPLPLPHPQALANSDRRCDDLAFSSGDKRLGETCKRRNHRGLDELSGMQNDPEIRVEFWSACNQAVGFSVSTEYSGWAKCVRFVRKSCPASKIHSDDDIRRCLRAIQSDGWILNSSSN